MLLFELKEPLYLLLKKKIVNLFPTKHAIGILSYAGCKTLIHVGIHTVNLKGQRFEALVAENDEVKQGQPLLKVDLNYLKEHVPSIITPIVFTNLVQDEVVVTNKQGNVELKEDNIISISK